MASKEDTAASVLLLLFGLAAKKSSGATVKNAPPKPLDAATDSANLVKRAGGGSSWASIFTDVPVSPLAAQALARWAGIESSGKAVNTSRLGERGLMQAGPSSVPEGLLTQAEFDALNSPATSKARHAQIAVKYVDGLARKAQTYVKNMGPDPIDRIFYAKLWHQWPVDVRDIVGPLAGELGTADAGAIGDALAIKWAADPVRMHRLRAAHVVAFGAAQ